MTAPSKKPKEAICRFALVVILAIAFGYIEAAVVVYLRQIFHPAGFHFPLPQFGLAATRQRLVIIEIAREAATLILILSACILSGRNRRQRLAYFLTIFAVWDIFYYVWLKVTLDWPASIMDWDILFLIPVPWASPVLAPVLVSLVMLLFAVMILYRDYLGQTIRASLWDRLGFSLAGLVIIISFCIPGLHISRPDYACYFSWPLFFAGLFGAVAIFTKCLYCKTSPPPAQLIRPA